MKILSNFNFLIILLALIIFDSGCYNKPSTKNAEIINDTNVFMINRDDSNNFKFVNNIPYKSFPAIDSTNFDNFSLKDSLTKTQIDLLELSKVDTNANTLFFFNYRLDLSKEYYTLVITYYPDENDLFTVLINYTKNFEIIDFKDIAFDEIAESCLRIESLIDSNRLEINEYNFCPEMFNYPEKKTSNYTIENNGKIISSH